MRALTRQLRPALLMVIVFTVLTGLAYPLVVTAVSQVAFHDRANGSLIERGGTIVGSRLIGQSFAAPQYFHPRPSAAAPATTAGPARARTSARPTPTCSTRSPSGPPPTAPRTAWPTARWCRSTP